MNFLNNIFGTSVPEIAQLAIAAAVAIVVLLILLWLFRKIFGNANSRIAKSRQPRLSITDAAIVDDKRRLVLVRRDAVEHLIMIGGPTDIVIEQNIVRAAPVAMPQTQAPVQAQTQMPAQAPISAPAKSQALIATKVPVEPVLEEPRSLAATSTAATLGAVSAAGAGLASLAGNTANAASRGVSDMGENAGSAISSSLSNVSESAAAKVSETAKIGSEFSASLQTGLEDVFGSGRTASLEPAVESDEPRFTENDNTFEGDKSKPSSSDDEMKRLLDELAAGN